VVVDGQYRLTDGSKVKVTSAEPQQPAPEQQAQR
jgi:hypothetical protein